MERQQDFNHPCIQHSSAPGWMCLHISVFCVPHVMCVYLSIPPFPTGTLQRVNPSLPACFATDRQLFITTSWLASELCPTVSNCYTGKPKHSPLTPTRRHVHTLIHPSRWRHGGGGEAERECIPLCSPPRHVLRGGSGSPSVMGRWAGGW